MADTIAAPVPAAAPTLYHNRGFLILVGGQFVSRAGDALLSLAAVWLVLELTGNNPLASGAALAFEFLPYALFGLIAGVLVDRWNRVRTMAVADAVRGVVLLAVPLLHRIDALHVWHIFAVMFVLSSLGRLFTPARMALLPDLVRPEQLVRANAISEGAGQVAWVLGPALGGVLVAVMGAVNIFYLDAASFLISSLSVLLIRVRHAAAPVPRTSMWQEAMGGVRYMRTTPVLAAVALLSLVGTLAFAPVPALLPVLVRGEFGGNARVFGALMACFFLGSVAGSGVVGRGGARLHRGRLLAGGIAGLGAAILALAAAPMAVPAGGALAVLGAFAAGFNVAEYSLLQQSTPPELRGRVFALANMMSQLLRPPGVIAAGLLAGAAGVRVSLAVMALTALAAGAAGLFNRALRETR